MAATETHQERQAGPSIPHRAGTRELATNSTSSSATLAFEPLGRFYRPELDVVRFLAFLLVFGHHFLPEGSGPSTAALPRSLTRIFYACAGSSGFGLCLFFTLSSYLICELLIREREAAGSVQAKQFYIRRILRI